MIERVLLAFCLKAAAAALTGAGSSENPLLIGSVFDTVSSQPQRNRSQRQTEVRDVGVEAYSNIIYI